MGNRVSIKFSNGEQHSPYLFSHWGGMEFVKEAKDYAKDLIAEAKASNGVEPLMRLEPERVILDFIRHLTKDMTRVMSDLYLVCNQNEGDDSDNGHHDIKLAEHSFETCRFCNRPTGKFRDAQSCKEHMISGMCQECQDKAFNK